jgi:hypothetical protein
MDWIGLAQEREKWRTLVKAVMKLGYHTALWIYGVATQLAALRVVFSSTELVSQRLNQP